MTTLTMLPLAMGQMLVEGGAPNQNLARAVQMISQASSRGCRIIVLPECLDLGWTHPSALHMAQPIPGAHTQILCTAAREHGIYVAAGLVERDGDHVYNSAVLISPVGDILLKHRKINELSIAHHLYTTGCSLAVADTSFGRTALNICADNFPNSLAIGHSQARMGARILLSPSSWAVPADFNHQKTPYGDLWEGSYKTLALHYQIPVIGVSNVGWLTAGPWEGQKCIGCSLAVGPDGEILAKGTYGEEAEELIVVEVPVVENKLRGTDIGEDLHKRGYAGP